MKPRALAPPVDLSEGLCVTDDDPTQWDGPGTSYAHHLCRELCPVRDECRADALEHAADQDGMRGNLWFDEGRLRKVPSTYRPRRGDRMVTKWQQWAQLRADGFAVAEIARQWGVHHTTVMHGIRKAEEMGS